MQMPRRPKGVSPSGYVLRAIIVLYLFQSTPTGAATTSRDGDVQTGTHVCDVLIAGGSLASAAAAVAASAASSKLTRVCFLEITDWPGGQASAGGDLSLIHI